MPKKGQDYLTEEDVNNIANKVHEVIKNAFAHRDYYTPEVKKAMIEEITDTFKVQVQKEIDIKLKKEKTNWVSEIKEVFEALYVRSFIFQKAVERLEKAIKSVVKSFDTTDFIAIARGLETLRGKDKLDASAIKNLPVPVTSVYSPTIIGAGAVAIERITGAQSGNNVTLDLTTLSSAWVSILGVFKDGQLLNEADLQSGWSRVGNSITALNASAADQVFMVEYTHA